VVDTQRHSGWDISLERALLRAAAEETAPPDVQRRALAALGLLVVATPAPGASLAPGIGSTARGGTLLTPWAVKVAVAVGLAVMAVGCLIVARAVLLEAHTSDAVVNTGSSVAPSPASPGQPPPGEMNSPDVAHHTRASGRARASDGTGPLTAIEP
jgi:hypothetical protein